jgi:hypothetical protein
MSELPQTHERIRETYFHRLFTLISMTFINSKLVTQLHLFLFILDCNDFKILLRKKCHICESTSEISS